MKAEQIILKKMCVFPDDNSMVQYRLKAGDHMLDMNALVSQKLMLHFSQKIICIHCGKIIKKSFQQGYCYPCARAVAAADLCQVRPELCHFSQGTCRDEQWGQENCFINHTIYLSRSSSVKVGITRTRNRVSRWIDQGAVEAIPVCETTSRLDAGLIEVRLAKIFTDKTSWQRMLKNEVQPADLCQERLRALENLPNSAEIRVDSETLPMHFTYPIVHFPVKVVSLNPEKNPCLGGILLGIKGQYLIFDTGVFNLRKYTGWECSLEVV